MLFDNMENAMKVRIAIATPESDRKLRERENRKGRMAAIDGLPRSACPWTGGLCEAWWLEGYDGVKVHKGGVSG